MRGSIRVWLVCVSPASRGQSWYGRFSVCTGTTAFGEQAMAVIYPGQHCRIEEVMEDCLSTFQRRSQGSGGLLSSHRLPDMLQNGVIPGGTLAATSRRCGSRTLAPHTTPPLSPLRRRPRFVALYLKASGVPRRPRPNSVSPQAPWGPHWPP